MRSAVLVLRECGVREVGYMFVGGGRMFLGGAGFIRGL